MLININPGFTDGSIVSLKIANGDELIARYVSETPDTITINRPLAIAASATGLGMMPWIFLGDQETLTLKNIHVLAIIKSKSDAATQYMESTTGIALR